jgi:hypothetical protein
MIPPAPASAQPQPVTAARPGLPSERCINRHTQYAKLQKRLSQSAAEGAMGSAKSLKLRATEDAALVSLAESLGGGSGCPAEDPPSALPYLLSALRCEKDKQAAHTSEGNGLPSCDMERWQPYKEPVLPKPPASAARTAGCRR